MDNIISQGIENKLIIFDEGEKNITYLIQNKKFRYSNPEEKIRAQAYTSLVLDYGYEPTQIDIESVVPHRVPGIFADIVVFEEEGLKTPIIIVECKREEASEGELQQAIEQGFGYANSLKARYLWMTSGIRHDYYNIQDFPAMERGKNRLADLPKVGEKKVARARYVKGGVGGFELKTLEEADLTRIFKQAHDALWGGGKRNPAEAFDELDKLIFCKIWDEKTKRKNGIPYDFQVFTDDETDDLKDRIQKLYENGRTKDPEVFKENIRLSNSELQTVVSYLAGINLNKTDLDSKGRAFETFMTGFFRGEFGQYFTPRNIVKFIVNSLPISNDSLVLDTACGSGGFLLHALDKVRIEANEYYDPDLEPIEHKRHWHDFAQHNLFGIEISESIARTAKMNMIIHDDGHTNVISFDGLEPIEKIREKTKNQGFKDNRFDFIITNPPFGAKVKYTEKRYIEDYTLGCKGVDWIEAKLKNINLNHRSPRDIQTTEVLFLEQCYRFLKPGGILAMVIPDSILTISSMQYVRDWIEEYWRITAVISLPQFAFAANGAGVKSSVIFLRKYDMSTTAVIQKAKARIQDSLFEMDQYGPAIESLIKEKTRVLKKGNTIIQKMEDELVAKLEALSIQGTLSSDEQNELIAQAKNQISAYKLTEEYEEWKKEISDDFNEKVNILKEYLQDSFNEEFKNEIENYEVLMAIAEDIGYDATGRITGNNELDIIANELSRFIKHVGMDIQSPFC